MSSAVVYKILHLESSSNVRSFCYAKSRKMLSMLDEVKSPTVDLSTADSVREFLSEHDDFKVNFVESYQGTGVPFPHMSGVVGVFASNFLAWKAFCESDASILIMLEDDVLLSSNFSAAMLKYLEQLPPGWDIFSFCVPDNCLHRYKGSELDGGICEIYQDWSAGGYAITKSGAIKVLEDIKTNGISKPLDHYLYSVERSPSGFYEPTSGFIKAYGIKPKSHKPARIYNINRQDSFDYGRSYIGSTEPLDLSTDLPWSKA